MDQVTPPKDEKEGLPFHQELFQPEVEKKDNAAPVLEQLNTDTPQSHSAIKQHLQKVADQFENYADKLLKMIKSDKSDKSEKSNDDLNKQKCPFMKVAKAVGLDYKGKEATDEKRDLA